MRGRTGAGWLMGALVPMAALAMSLTPAPGLPQDHSSAPGPRAPGPAVVGQQGGVAGSGKPLVVLQYAVPASATWGASPDAAPTHAFGKPAEVLLVIPGGYVVRQELPLDEAIRHATYVSGQIGQPVAVTIPDPAGGPPRIEYVGTPRNDR